MIYSSGKLFQFFTLLYYSSKQEIIHVSEYFDQLIIHDVFYKIGYQNV